MSTSRKVIDQILNTLELNNMLVELVCTGLLEGTTAEVTRVWVIDCVRPEYIVLDYQAIGAMRNLIEKDTIKSIKILEVQEHV